MYEQAGKALGISAHAEGGYVDGSFLRNYNETTEGKYGESIPTTEPASTEKNAVSSPIQVNINMTPEFVIHGEEGQSEEDIMYIIRRHMKEMADELGGEIAGRLEEVFSNMPLKEA